MEGDFPRLYLNDIEDMLLLVIHNRLFNLKGEDIVHLAAALHMFTRRIVIQKSMEDLQLDPQGVIYEDKLNIKRLMRSNELYKFDDGTLQSVYDTLHDMATNLRMGKSFNKNTKHKALYYALMESILEDEDAMDKGVADKLKKKKPDDADKDEGPPARSNQGLKRKKTSNDAKPSKKAKYPFDLSKPLSLVQSRNRQIVLVDYFFNNDLTYLQGGSTDRTYTTSLTKTKVAKYNLPGIEDMVPTLWSPIKVAYDKHDLLGDFPRLHLNDIEDMLLLVVHNRLFNLKGEDIVHLAAALHMFTRHIVIQKSVEDLQLGIESYQKKLNISKPRTRN
nr:hypothetical protein [Tanacetum cinerariifolium]